MRAVAPVILSAMLCATPVLAQELRLTPEEIAAKPVAGATPGTAGIAAIQVRVLTGDPSKPGPYTIEIRVPPNTRVKPHTHKDTRAATVLSGTWYVGYGAAAGDDLLKALPAGGFYIEPAAIPHFAMTRDEPAVVRISGWGPSDTVYVDPAQAPKP